MTALLQKVKNNIDTKTVVSAALGVAMAGAVIYAIKKTGIKPLKEVAKVAQGGK